MRRKLWIVIISSLVCVCLFFCFFAQLNPHSPVSFFKKYKNELRIVAEFLSELEHEKIYIDSFNGSYTVLSVASDNYTITTHTYPIEDENVKLAIRHLLVRAKCKEIKKRDGAITVLRWTWLMDFGSGFAYAIDGSSTPEILYLTKLEPMADENWYYYESDYNEWRLSN